VGMVGVYFMLDFKTSISIGFRRTSDFKGRSTRAELWWWMLFFWLAMGVLGILDLILNTSGIFLGLGLFQGMFSLSMLIPTIGVGTRRLHDINKSGWWQVLYLIVIVGWIILIMWWTQPTHGRE
jgi:uncharacterized membrane protein YhaH (DUF805 family)